MDIVLGVSMTPTAVRMALVEGQNADGVTLDQESFDMAVDRSLAISGAAEQVVAAILGTRESAAEGGHHLVSTGVAWTDHAAAAEVRDALRAQRIEDVILVSELHAAGALAQAIGQAVGCERTALLFLERDTATLAVVRTADGSVVRVSSRTLRTADAVAELQDMVAGLEAGDDPAQTLFMVGSGVDIAALKPKIAARTSLPVHAPEEGELALARGAALASVNTPRYEASTVSLASTEDTSAGATLMAAAGYMAPLGYSAVPDDDADFVAADYVGLEPAPDNEAEADSRPFLLVGSALSTIFVVGVVALVISLAVAIRPTAEQRPDPSGSAVVSSSQAPPPAQARDVTTPAAPETIQAPIPVVAEAPRTVFVTPGAAGPALVAPPAAPAPAAELAPAPEPAPPPPPAPPPAPSAAAPAPASPFIPPIVLPVPIVIPPIFQAPVRSTPVPRYPSTTPTYPTTTNPTYPTYPSSPTRTTESSTPPPTTSYPTYTPPVTTQAPSSRSGAGSGSSGKSGRDGSEGSSGSNGSGSSSGGSQTIWPPLWPFGG